MRARASLSMHFGLLTSLCDRRGRRNGLFCPNECPDLHDSYGEEFNALYAKYESEGRARKTIKARELWDAITQSQIETNSHAFTKTHVTTNPIKRTWVQFAHPNLCTRDCRIHSS